MSQREPELSVVMPVYNERPTIQEILWRVQQTGLDLEIVVVDDGSTDGTRELLRALEEEKKRGFLESHTAEAGKSIHLARIRFLFQERNFGKGAAVRRGFQEATGRFLIIQDADLELDPADYPALIRPLQTGQADVVYGSRFLASRPSTGALFYLANRILTGLANHLTGMRLSDAWSGYKVFRREVVRSLMLREDRFGFEAEVTAKVAKGGWRVCEVPVRYRARTYRQGKKIKIRDGLHGIWCTVRYSLFD